jgi:acyl-CoA thioester hydrolase
LSQSSSSSHQLPPTRAIATDQGLRTTSENWFEYRVRAQPHHTDYAGIVWHGSYLVWMEEARVECLRSNGIDFAELVRLGCDLPVVDLSLRYHRALPMGMEAIVKTRMSNIDGVRINWDYKIQSTDGQQIYVSGKVTLVAVDREKGKILRQLPPAVKDALMRLS